MTQPSISHLQFNLTNCPTCDQQIPPDKVEQVVGRLAAREREQTAAITAQLEQKWASDKSAIEANAREAVEAERQQSAQREQQVRDEAKRAAEKFINEKQVQAEQERTTLVAGWEQRLAESESARNAAQQTGATLQAEIVKVQRDAAGAIEAVKAEAKEREAQIQSEARRAAESAATERIKQVEASHNQSEAALQARITAAEAGRIAAEENRTTAVSQLEELQRTKDTELNQVRQQAAAELALVRESASQEAEARFRDALAARDEQLASANAKVTAAETKLVEVSDLYAAELDAQLKAQRDVLDKDKEEAVNLEKARSFEEHLKLSNKVSDLQRVIDNKTAEELGEGAELNLYEALKQEFPEDDIHRVTKGTAGADIIHQVRHAGKKCGTIIYDSKNHNQFRNEHISKLRADQLAAHAEHAILSTRKFPQGTRQLHIQDGVILANPARVVLIATMIRNHLLQLHAQRVGEIERDSKIAALYDFMGSELCTSLFARIDERADDLIEEQNKEMRWHDAHWKREGEAIRGIQKAKADLVNQVSLIIGTAAKDAAA